MVGIYKITNPKGKIYIGQSVNLKKRKRNYSLLSQTKGQPLIHHSILKYGWENHKFEIIEECSIEELNQKEIYWMSFFNCIEEGLNLKEGGYNIGKHHPQTIIKMRNTKLNKKQPWSVPQATLMGKANKGKIRTEEFKNNIRLNNSKPVLQYDKQGNFIKKWECGFDAARFLGKQNSAISECCYGKRKTAYNYIWKFKE
jgi:group I intron endonuclease